MALSGRPPISSNSPGTSSPGTSSPSVWQNVFGALLFGLAGLLCIDACAGVPACERNSDCLAGYCSEGECKQDCVVSDLDCPTGYFCNLVSQCEQGEGGASSSSGSGGATTGGGSSSNGGGSVGGAASSSSAAGGSAAGGFGGASTSSSTGAGGGIAGLPELTLCSSDAQCATGLGCRSMERNGVQRCTKPCSNSAQCPGALKCMDDGTGFYCRQSDVGRSCTTANGCNFACLTPANYCTAECSSGADCPSGYGCMPIGAPAVNVCIRAEAACDNVNTSACVAAAACDLSPNLILGSCTTTCNSAADCPHRAAPLAPWTCDGLCRRPPDVFGPLPGGSQPTEWYCDAALNPIVLCNDAQHLDFQTFTIPNPPIVDCFASVTTTGLANDSCANSCRYQGGCSFGFECVAVGGVNQQRIGLCLPRGNKEPGASCVSNTECAFGYCNNSVCSRDCSSDGLCISGQSCVPGGGPAVEGMPFMRCE